MLAHSYSHLFGLPTTGLRFFTGPSISFGSSVTVLLRGGSMRAGADRRCHPYGERWRRPAVVHRRITSTGFRADPFLGRSRPSGRTCVRSRSTTSQVSGALAYADVPEAARFHLGRATNVAKINQNGAVKAALDAVPIPRDRGTLEINLLAAYWLGREGSHPDAAEIHPTRDRAGP